MILFQQIRFKSIFIALVISGILVQTSFAIQIEVPKEIQEHVLAYSNAAGAAENTTAILRISIIKNIQCGNVFAMKLINKSNGKTIKEVEQCFTDSPNAAMQDGIFEIFGHSTKAKTFESGNIKTALIGAGFVVTGLLLYYTNQPKPVYLGNKNEIEVSQ